MDFQGLQRLLATLSEIGLNAKEANAYLTLLSIGSNPASVIAKKVKINRSSCYSLLERLMQKGFIQQYIKDNVTYYNAVEPKYILDQLKNKKFELEDKIDNLGNSIAQFELLKNEYRGKPRVVFFEGEAGVQNIMEDTLTSKTVVRAYASLNELTGLFPGYWPNYYKRRAQKGVFVKAIYPADELSYLHKLRDVEELRESRLIPKEFDFHLDIMIYDNKMAITSLREKFGVLIESKEMAESQRRIFDFIWEGATKYDDMMMKRMETKYKPKPKRIKLPQEK
jgi:sugar-specific transcriptional regulator TrmB